MKELILKNFQEGVKVPKSGHSGANLWKAVEADNPKAAKKDFTDELKKMVDEDALVKARSCYLLPAEPSSPEKSPEKSSPEKSSPEKSSPEKPQKKTKAIAKPVPKKGKPEAPAEMKKLADSKKAK
jgi:hypothetical protein